MNDCIFCAIAAGGLPSIRVHEDDRAIAIMDINPATRGHVLVVPRSHCADIRDIADEDLAHCAVVAKRLAERAIDALGAAGVTIVQANGAAGWQTVFHYHVHVIPRYPNDGLREPWTPTPTTAAELEEISGSYFSD
jgi:histidine triad (HIT) family protein